MTEKQKKRIVLATINQVYWFHKEREYTDFGRTRKIVGSRLHIDKEYDVVRYSSEEEKEDGFHYVSRDTKIYRFEEQKQ